jgi:hypothetical protein
VPSVTHWCLLTLELTGDQGTGAAQRRTYLGVRVEQHVRAHRLDCSLTRFVSLVSRSMILSYTDSAS